MSKRPPRPEFDGYDFLSGITDSQPVFRSKGLPRRTIIAPADFVQQFRVEFGPIDIQISPGDSTDLLSPDLYDAFREWNGGDTRDQLAIST